MVITVPATFIVQGYDKQVDFFEVLKGFLPPVFFQYGIAQGRTHPVQYGCGKQKGL
jgi:hypothetical protein